MLKKSILWTAPVDLPCLSVRTSVIKIGEIMVLVNKSGLVEAQITNYYSLIKSMFEIQKFKTYKQIDVPIPDMI